FFSGRRRHTRFSRDWSSDVCSSDLRMAGPEDPGLDQLIELANPRLSRIQPRALERGRMAQVAGLGPNVKHPPTPEIGTAAMPERSEERRVGEAVRARWPE